MTTDLVTSLLPVRLKHIDKAELLQYFENSWELNELLFSALIDDSVFYQRPDPLRNPLIFYYGHCAAFYINKLKLAGLRTTALNPAYDELFAKGVDPDIGEDFDHVSFWPSVDEVRNYRAEVFACVVAQINAMEAQEVSPESPYWAILMAIEHDRIHFETSSVLVRQLPVEAVQRPEAWNYAPSQSGVPTPQWIDLEGGKVRLGRGKETDLFAWDNEFGTREIAVKPFQATKNLITNAEYLRFLQTAYHDEKHWTSEGWRWKNETHTTHPKFWVKEENEWKYRAMFDVLPMPMDWPVEVNAFEALAYCAWIGDGARLMTEGEFNFAANMEQRQEPLFSCIGNLNFKYGSPTPVGFENDPHAALNDLYGNVWDWLGDSFNPLEGFKTHPLYSDFSEPYFDEDHLMMLGASWATTGTGASKYYRLWFRKFFYQHAGFRLAKSCAS